jgi:hypothetical protein
MFRLSTLTTIRQSLSTDARSVQYVNEWNMYINYLQQ